MGVVKKIELSYRRVIGCTMGGHPEFGLTQRPAWTYLSSLRVCGMLVPLYICVSLSVCMDGWGKGGREERREGAREARTVVCRK